MDRLKSALSWQGPLYNEPGLQDVSIPDAMNVYGPAKGLLGALSVSPRLLASEAGAIFPEGAPLPMQDPVALKELGQILPPSQASYAQNLANYAKHAANYDWPAVLSDKWGLLRHSVGGN
ncbi:MAG: hypothetical protein C5B54_11340 [Acidobacteria bacterium]|nr:MAG: hypothetical protein C5B54_11340 [Acidobacteriota bacterium]